MKEISQMDYIKYLSKASLLKIPTIDKIDYLVLKLVGSNYQEMITEKYTELLLKKIKEKTV